MRLLTWNLEFAEPSSARASTIAAVIQRNDPDVACLTETHARWPFPDGHAIWADADYGYPLKNDRRKVGLWSRTPWTDVDTVGHADLPSGRFIAGTTETELGPIRAMGVCIPWRMAHVATGRRDRAAWEDHVAYLHALRPVLADSIRVPLVVAGDFNQRIPRKYTPQAVHDNLVATFAPLTIVTGGQVNGLDGLLIDHVAIGAGLRAGDVRGISRYVDGARLSDHDGVVADVESA